MCVQCECKEAVAVVIQVFDNVCVFSGDKWQVRLQPPKPAGFEAGQIHAPITRDVQYSRPYCQLLQKYKKLWAMIFLCFFLTERGRGSLANPENTFEK